MKVLLSLIEPDWNHQQWIAWLDEEIVNTRKRFGNDSEALLYYPDDYYQKMEMWWSKGNAEPIELELQSGFYRILDGWHRVAICHKLNISSIPAIIKENKNGW